MTVDPGRSNLSAQRRTRLGQHVLRARCVSFITHMWVHNAERYSLAQNQGEIVNDR